MRRTLRLAPLVVALASAGCVERALLVRTDPPGARVWVNGDDRGTSPVTVAYMHPGRFDLRIEKDGYESIADEVLTPTTLDAIPGPDFFAENVWPGTIRNQTVASYRLDRLKQTSYTKDELQALWHAAEAFRAKARAAASEPDTPKPERAPGSIRRTGTPPPPAWPSQPPPKRVP